MEILTLLSAAGGVLTRLAPEAIKLFMRKDERKHELEMAKLGIDKSKLDSESAEEVARFNTIAEGYKSSGSSGIGWLDGFNGSVRAVTMYIFLIMLFMEAYSLIQPIQSETRCLISAAFGYWFVNRTLRK